MHWLCQPRSFAVVAAWLLSSLLSAAIACGQTIGDEAPEFWPTQPAPLAAAEPAAYHTTTEMESVLRRLDALETQTAKSVQPAPAAPKPADGWIDVSKEKWTVRLGGHVQLDLINWAQASPAIVGDQNYFEFRRLRLSAEGTGYGVLDFRLQLTLEPESVGDISTPQTPEVKDAYLSMNEVPFLGRFRIGNFFVPFGLEQVTNDRFNIFLERSIPTQGIFTADREVGMAFYNCTEDQRLTWCGGVFLDSISEALKERIDDNQGCRVSGRVTWLPYYNEPSNGRYLIHTGLGILYTDDHDNRVRFRARPQIHEGPFLINSGILNATSNTTGNVELAIVAGPVTVQSEAFVSSVNLIGAGAVNVQGAYAHLSYFLTGENRNYERFGQHGAQFAGITPFSNFFWVPGSFSPGAWEFRTRWSLLDLNQVNAGQYNDLTVGFNWYWNERVRVMFDWIHPITSSQTVFGATQSDILGMRFDFAW
ncbi:MAG TPA: porin [Pirellulaceae bacterium]|nr:porin [Pirellulaceae bacterium]